MEEKPVRHHPYTHMNRRAVLRAGGALISSALYGHAAWTVTAGTADTYGPTDGQLVHPAHNMNGAMVRTQIPRADADYAVSATFHNPYGAMYTGTFDRAFTTPDSYRQWSYGFDFRVTPERGGYLYVTTRDLSWNAAIYTRTDPNARQQVVQMWRGDLVNLTTGSDETNALQFTASGLTGQFMLNGEEIAALDLSALAQPGAVVIGAGYDNQGFSLIPGAITAYQGFQIIPAPVPTPLAAQALAYRYGPVSGGIRQMKQGSNSSSTSQFGEGFNTGARMNDGIINGRFFAPGNAGSGEWDFGFWFRANTMGSTVPVGYCALALRSDATYRLSTFYPVSRAYNETERQRGPIAGMRTEAGEYNDVEVRAVGAEGVLSVNGYEIARLDLHDYTGEGSVSFLTAMTVPAQAGVELRYEGFTVAALTADP